MKIPKGKIISIYRDGGTQVVKIEKSGEIVYVDNRIGTETRGAIYDKYPNDENANLIPQILIID